MTSTEPAADATDSAPVVQRSRWSRLSYRIALLIAVLLAGSAIATTLFSVRSIQRETLQQSSQSVNNVHRGVTALIDTEARNTAQYATSALATRKKSLQDQSASATVALDTLRAAVAAGQISLSDAQAQALQMLKTIRFGENTYFFTYNRALTAISHPDPRYQGKNLRDLRGPQLVQPAAGAAGGAQDAGPGTDFYAVSQSRVSVTPLQVDLTHVAQMQKVQQWLN